MKGGEEKGGWWDEVMGGEEKGGWWDEVMGGVRRREGGRRRGMATLGPMD